MERKIIVYQPNADVRLEVQTDGETVWLTQAQICQLLGRERSVITKHIGNAIREGEIDAKSNVHILHIANSDKPVKIYDLDVVISVGYRVKSLQGTMFRRWATRVLREMLLRRYEELAGLVKLEKRVDTLEGNVNQLQHGLNYLVQQITNPPTPPRRKIGFAVDKR